MFLWLGLATLQLVASLFAAFGVTLNRRRAGLGPCAANCVELQFFFWAHRSAFSLHHVNVIRTRTSIMATNSIKLLTGNSHPQLAKLVAER